MRGKLLVAMTLASAVFSHAETTSSVFRVGEFKRVYDPSAGEEKPWYVNDHCLMYGPGSKWHLFGITHEEPAAPQDEDHLAHATADKLLQPQWVKQPFALSVDSERWNETHLWAPHVVKHGDLYYMFYCAGDPDHSKYKIHLATSKDLESWTRHPDNPMVVDGFDARDPFVMKVGDKWVMYYTANEKPAGGHHVVACAASDNLTSWSGRRIVYRDPTAGKWGGPTESPFVVRRGEVYYLFIGPRGDYDATEVFLSEDPFSWNVKDKVGRIDAHAAEVVRDTDGKWYVSRCGWGRGGVYLAPLFWTDGLDTADTSLPPAGKP